MALLNLSLYKTPLKPLLLPSPLKLQNPNPNSSSLCFPSSSCREKKPFATVRCSYEQLDRALCPRPEEIPWSKELANSVHLIGAIGATVQIKQLSSGKVLAWTSLAVKKSATETSWINLTFWDELAQVAFSHVEKGQQVYVSGRLVSDTVEREDDTRQVYYKVVVQKLNFIERSYPAGSLYDSGAKSTSSDGNLRNYGGNSSGTIEELWQAFFANPVDWWDNRRNKRNPNYPDFKHKDTGEALWVEGKLNPSWVKSQLAILDTRLGSMQDSENSFTHGDEFSSF